MGTKYVVATLPFSKWASNLSVAKGIQKKHLHCREKVGLAWMGDRRRAEQDSGSGSGAEVACGAGKDAGGGWGPSQMSWSPELLIWLSLPPEHSGLSVLFSYLLDWSCPCTRTCSADLQDIYSISVMQGLWNVWIHHPDLLLTGSVVGQLLLLEPRVLIYGRQVMVPLVPSQQMLLGRERRDPVTCLAVCLAQHP